MAYIAYTESGPGSFQTLLHKAKMSFYSKVVIPVNSSDLPHEFKLSPMVEKSFDNSYPDILISNEDWQHHVIVMLSDNFDCDSPDPLIRKHSEEVLRHDLSQAWNLVNKQQTIIRLKKHNNTNMARICASQRLHTLLVQVPMYNAYRQHAHLRADFSNEKLSSIRDDFRKEYDSWHWWNDFRWHYNFNSKLRVVLELDYKCAPSMEEVYRWLNEPLDAILIPSKIFTFVEKAGPILEKHWYKVVKFFLRAQIGVIISGRPNDIFINSYVLYIVKMKEEFLNLGCDQNYNFHKERAALGTLIYPLVTRLNDLQYSRVQVDQTKYLKYEEALRSVMFNNSSRWKISRPVIAVINVGRGIILSSILSAAVRYDINPLIYAIEKDLMAAHSLQKYLFKDWKKWNIYVIVEDPREVMLRYKADLLVHEIYGIFGESELAPEYMDCVLKNLKPNGICIPKRFSTHIQPVMSPILHTLITHQFDFRKRMENNRYINDFPNNQCFFTAQLETAYYLDTPREVFGYDYPTLDQQPEYNLFKVLKFNSRSDGTLTGFSGHLEAVLFNKIKITQVYPEAMTDLKTWSAIYFPLQYPIEVKKNETIEVHFWRCTDDEKIWYEWCLVAPRITRLQNVSGIHHSLYKYTD